MNGFLTHYMDLPLLFPSLFEIENSQYVCAIPINHNWFGYTWILKTLQKRYNCLQCITTASRCLAHYITSSFRSADAVFTCRRSFKSLICFVFFSNKHTSALYDSHISHTQQLHYVKSAVVVVDSMPRCHSLLENAILEYVLYTSEQAYLMWVLHMLHQMFMPHLVHVFIHIEIICLVLFHVNHFF